MDGALSLDPLKGFQRHKKVWARALRLFFENGAMVAAGNMAFLAMLSLFPFIIFLISVSGFLGQTDRGLEAIAFIMSILPPEVGAVIEGPIAGIINNTGAEILTFSILFAIWTAANGVEAARDVLITAFGREHARAMWVRRLESLGIVVVGAVAMLVAMSILVLGPPLLKAVTSLFPDEITGGMLVLWRYLSLLVSPAILMFGLYVIYLALTPRRVKRPYRFPGTLLSLIMLIATARGLSVYLKYANTYDVTYGSLAGVVVLQLFCFLVSLGFVLGAELNAAYTFTRNTGAPAQSAPSPETIEEAVTETPEEPSADADKKN